ncbi:biotin-dependent carboxyltransferase family protein [Paenibacillus thalictri]|uniref:Biotin-dependent carboxyltransferase n=1 Tax=Paenibacillus thalictri TaxID=2527873 RepID=A0A4Q9DTJ1_9BACL|nr:biotin-dependent carboxyltransferase family protein [Paenibacillus thalictri]TBL78682.1 biotin-dependent carboxyltransferase [Paenibacillus thalictri]
MSIHVRKPGMLTTLQDLGRWGLQRYGVIVGGAMDSFAHRAAQLLVGNAGTEASLEMTVTGAHLVFEQPALIAICGAEMNPQADGQPVPMWRPVYVREGTVLQFGAARLGCRCYLAVAGGFDVPPVMNSQSTYIRAGLGGFRGRALQPGDKLEVKPASQLAGMIAGRLSGCLQGASSAAASWSVTREMIPPYEANPTVRIISGAQYESFTAESKSRLTAQPYVVQPQSDRMGYRLAGPPLQLAVNKEMISEPVTFGTVQVPPDGQPIVLMADRQTTGGYPKAAQVITADLPLLAQLQMGGAVRFKMVDLHEAQEELLISEFNMNVLKKSIRMQLI